MCDSLPIVYFSNGKFLVWDLESVKKLRDCRIFGQFIGIILNQPNQLVTSGLPYLLSPNSAKLVANHGLGSFRKIILKNISLQTHEDNQNLFKEHQQLIFKQENVKYVARRQQEMSDRCIPITEERIIRIGTVPEDKVELHINREPIDGPLSISCSIEIIAAEVDALIKVDITEYKVFEDLWKQGFRVTPGTKFGAEFLAYRGDPLMYHAKYAVRAVSNLDESMIGGLELCDINAFQRLCHTAHKTPLIAIANDSTVHYWTLPFKELVAKASSTKEMFTPVNLTSDDDEMYQSLTKNSALKRGPDASLDETENKLFRR